jgi:hypothetical protein
VNSREFCESGRRGKQKRTSKAAGTSTGSSARTISHVLCAPLKQEGGADFRDRKVEPLEPFFLRSGAKRSIVLQLAVR